jgi:hypothetical protein
MSVQEAEYVSYCYLAKRRYIYVGVEMRKHLRVLFLLPNPDLWYFGYSATT